jgi:ubiquinone/menaquinone biosynthesis C-methylase UbiE
MSNVKDYILKESEFVGDAYVMQTETFSSVEFPLLIEIFGRNKYKTVLDIGTGEGNWINKFASYIKDIPITAIDADSKLIEIAKTAQSSDNIDFQNAMFNKDYSTQSYDCILARFSMEHVHDPDAFVNEAFKRLNPDGMFIVTEWFIDVQYNSNQIWAKFRKKEDEIYKEMESHPRLALSLPFLFRKNGFSSVKSSYHCISPTTVNYLSFYNLTMVYAILYNKINPNIFTPEFTKQLIDYCKESIIKAEFTEDYYLITQTTGVKSW